MRLVDFEELSWVTVCWARPGKPCILQDQVNIYKNFQISIYIYLGCLAEQVYLSGHAGRSINNPPLLVTLLEVMLTRVYHQPAQNPPPTKHTGEDRDGLLRNLLRYYGGFVFFFFSCFSPEAQIKPVFSPPTRVFFVHE